MRGQVAIVLFFAALMLFNSVPITISQTQGIRREETAPAFFGLEDLPCVGEFFDAVAHYVSKLPFSGRFFEKRMQEPIDYVNPLIGTGEIAEAMGGGHTYPGVGAPFGMTQWTAQTNIRGKYGVPYYYEDGVIQGIRGTHYPSGSCMDDYGAVTIMPITGQLKVDPEARASAFSHNNETAKPYYYKVFLEDYKITSEHTATERCAIFQFTYPESDRSYVLINPTELVNALSGEGYVKINTEDREIIGYNSKGGGWRNSIPSPFAGYFVAEFDRDFSAYGTWNGDAIEAGSTEAKGNGSVGAFVEFETRPGDRIRVKIATSFIGFDQARENMQREIPSWDMNNVTNGTRDVWNAQLSTIEIEGGSEAERTLFYASLYHAMLLPREFSEHGRYYSPFDGKVHNGVYYEDFSMWDTFRAEHPLLIMLEPQRSTDMINSLISMYEEGGWIPKWPNPYYSNDMIGTHSDSIIADAYTKGLRGFDAEKAYEGMRKHATVEVTEDMWEQAPFEGRPMLNAYKERGYIPIDVHSEVGRKRHEQVSQTLEYAYDDFCIAQMAKALGRDEDYAEFSARAQNYKNLFDCETGFMNGRYRNGSWFRPLLLSPVPSEWLSYGEENGLKGEYFNNKELSGKPELTRIDKRIEFDWGSESPSEGIDRDGFSVRWRGKLSLPENVNGMCLTTDDGVRVFIDGEPVLDSWYNRGPTTDQISLKGGRSYNITIEYYDTIGGAVSRLEYPEGYLPFDPTTQYNFYTEANAWQYLWFVPQDVEGLIHLMGGKERFIERLDEFFASGQYWHGNEPGHHIAYLYDCAGAPWKTQEKVREIMENEYKLIPAGLCGNDDAGQMSAWYVFSAMGFYPVCPGEPTYQIGSPLFDRVIIHLSDGEDFVIEAHNNSAQNRYIQSATLDGAQLNRSWFEHSALINGGALTLEMGPKPNKEWGAVSESAP